MIDYNKGASIATILKTVFAFITVSILLFNFFKKGEEEKEDKTQFIIEQKKNYFPKKDKNYIPISNEKEKPKKQKMNYYQNLENDLLKKELKDKICDAMHDFEIGDVNKSYKQFWEIYDLLSLESKSMIRTNQNLNKYTSYKSLDNKAACKSFIQFYRDYINCKSNPFFNH